MTGVLFRRGQSWAMTLSLILCLPAICGAARPQLESLNALSGQPPSHRQLNVQQWRTEQQAKVLFVETRELPMFDVRLIFAAGSAYDGKTPGLALLTNAMLNEGVDGKDASAIAAGFEDLGARFSNGSYRDMAVAGLRTLSASDKAKPALDLFSQVVARPTFPQDALTRIKNQLLASFEYQKQNPGKQASQAFYQKLYGQHPYAHPSEGDEKNLPSITVDQLKAFHNKAYVAENVTIAIVGDLSRAEAERIANQIGKALPPGPALERLPTPKKPSPGLTEIPFASEQTHVLMGQLGVDRLDPDYPALYLGNQVLGGGGFGSILMEEIREKRGLTYGIYSGFSAMQAPGPFTISFQTRASYSGNTMKLIRDIVKGFLADGPTQEELDQAKRETIGSFPLSTASNADIVSQLGVIGFYNLPPSYLEDFLQQVDSLTREQVKQTMQKHLDPDDFVIVTVGPAVAQEPLPPPTDSPSSQPETRAH